MIEGIGKTAYEAYNTITNQVTAKAYEEEQKTPVFNIQEILKEIGEYTYSQEEKGTINEKLLTNLQKKFDIEEEEIYKLKNAGFDLEKLYIEDYSGYEAVGKVNSVSKTRVATKSTDQLNEKIDTIKKQNDNMYLYALTSNKTVTINSLYESNFKGNFKKTNKSYTKDDITNVLQMNGLASTKGNQWAANMLVTHGMDVNKQGVVKLQNIQAAINSLEKGEEAKKAQEDLEQNKQVGERPLIKDEQVAYDYAAIKKIKDDLGAVTDADIEELVTEDKEITITNLREVLYRNTEIALKGTASKTEEVGEVVTKEEVKEIKDQIGQIRAKLTTEAAQKISEKLPLESSQLSEVVQELTAIEDHMVMEAIKNADLEPTEENVEIIKDVIAVRENILENKELVVEVEVQAEEEATLKEIQTALLAYGENESVAERRFGESIQTVADQITQVLEAQGIEVTEETIQAAKALILNNQEITEEKIQDTLNITIKINTFLEEMTPTQAAILIKEGLNPYEASIDTILDWISKEKIDTLKNSVAESIVALEEKKMVSSEQKGVMIGLYRIMQAVSKNKEEVIGYLYKNELPLTVEKLQEAAKYIGSKSHIEVGIDDDFGVLEDTQITAKTAKTLIEENREHIAKSLDIVKLLEDMALPITEDSIEKLKKINAVLYPFIKEQFKQALGKFEGMSTLPKSFLDKLDYIKGVDGKVIETMLTEEIPLTISNIYWMDKIHKDPGIYAEILEQKGLLKEEIPSRLEEVKEELESLQKEVKQQKEIAIDTGDILSYKNYKQIEEAVNLQKELMDKSGHYQIPFLINGQEKLINLYINKDASHKQDDTKGLKAVISYETNNMGTVEAHIDIREDKIGYKIKGETAEATARLKQNSEQLEKLINNIGYFVKYSEYQELKIENEAAVSSTATVRIGDSDFEEIV